MADEDTYEIPLQDQRVFGAGIKRKRVHFVPSQSTDSWSVGSKASTTVGDLYLRLVLPQESAKSEISSAAINFSPSIVESTIQTASPAQECAICHLPISSEPDISNESDRIQEKTTEIRLHEASIVHQICLEHSHPPSHIDRKRKGLAYLAEYGYDPDARVGLGAQGQGIKHPIKVKLKKDNLGIGATIPELPKKKVEMERLDAKKVGKLQELDRRKTERLREMFYRNDDVERYLGSG